MVLQTIQQRPFGGDDHEEIAGKHVARLAADLTIDAKDSCLKLVRVGHTDLAVNWSRIWLHNISPRIFGYHRGLRFTSASVL